MPRRPGGPAPPTRNSHRTSAATDALISELRSMVLAITGRKPRTDALIFAAAKVGKQHIKELISELPPA